MDLLQKSSAAPSHSDVVVLRHGRVDGWGLLQHVEPIQGSVQCAEVEKYNFFFLH